MNIEELNDRIDKFGEWLETVMLGDVGGGVMSAVWAFLLICIPLLILFPIWGPVRYFIKRKVRYGGKKNEER